jgi:hypothetical protein
MKTIIVESECPEYGTSTKILFTTIHISLVIGWEKNYTRLHCLAHLLNPKYYNNEWLNGGPLCRFPPHLDREISQGRKETFRRIYQDNIPW